MLRLILAACTAYILLPTNLEPKQLTGNTETVTTFQALTAADTIVRDIAGLCERNSEACATGISLLNNAKHMVLATIGTGVEQNKTETEDSAIPIVSDAAQ